MMYSNLKYKFQQIRDKYLNDEIDSVEVMDDIETIIDEYEEKMKGAILWSKEDFIERAKEQFDYEMDEDEAESLTF